MKTSFSPSFLSQTGNSSGISRRVRLRCQICFNCMTLLSSITGKRKKRKLQSLLRDRKRLQPFLRERNLQRLNEAGDNGLNLVETVLEEVVGALNGDQAFGGWHLLEPLLGEFEGGKVVLGSLNDQFGFVAALQGIAVEGASRDAEADHGLHTIIAGGHAQPDPGAEGEAGQDDGQARVAAAQKIQGVAHIVRLAAPLVVCSRAVTHAAKIETKRRNAQRLHGLCHFEDDLVMHRAAIERVGVQRQPGVMWSNARLLRLQNALQVPLWRWDIDMQYLADGSHPPFLMATEKVLSFSDHFCDLQHLPLFLSSVV